VSVRRLLAAVVALFAAYVIGRAVGILLDVNPYVTEIVAMAIVIAVLAGTAARR